MEFCEQDVNEWDGVKVLKGFIGEHGDDEDAEGVSAMLRNSEVVCALRQKGLGENVQEVD